MRCSHCKQVLRTGNAFCSHCGVPVRSEERVERDVGAGVPSEARSEPTRAAGRVLGAGRRLGAAQLAAGAAFLVVMEASGGVDATKVGAVAGVAGAVALAKRALRSGSTGRQCETPSRGVQYEEVV